MPKAVARFRRVLSVLDEHAEPGANSRGYLRVACSHAVPPDRFAKQREVLQHDHRDGARMTPSYLSPIFWCRRAPGRSGIAGDTPPSTGRHGLRGGCKMPGGLQTQRPDPPVPGIGPGAPVVEAALPDPLFLPVNGSAGCTVCRCVSVTANGNGHARRHREAVHSGHGLRFHRAGGRHDGCACQRQPPVFLPGAVAGWSFRRVDADERTST